MLSIAHPSNLETANKRAWSKKSHKRKWQKHYRVTNEKKSMIIELVLICIVNATMLVEFSGVLRLMIRCSFVELFTINYHYRLFDGHIFKAHFNERMNKFETLHIRRAS